MNSTYLDLYTYYGENRKCIRLLNQHDLVSQGCCLDATVAMPLVSLARHESLKIQGTKVMSQNSSPSHFKEPPVPVEHFFNPNTPTKTLRVPFILSGRQLIHSLYNHGGRRRISGAGYCKPSSGRGHGRESLQVGIEEETEAETD